MNLEPVHTIADLCVRSRAISLEKGWLNEDGTDPRPFHTVIGLLHTELSEAFEDIRANRRLDELYYEVTLVTGRKLTLSAAERRRHEADATQEHVKSAKPCGFPVELADFVIRVCQYYGSAGAGQQLQDRVEELEESMPDRSVADDGEQLITQLHTNVSFAFAGPLLFLNTHLPQNPLHYLAMALVTTFDFCVEKGIDLWAAIDEKEAYNRTRAQKHGGKKC